MTLLNCARDLSWIGCVDFGTAYSKFAMVRAVDREALTKKDIQPLDISVGPDYRSKNEYLLPSVLYLTEDKLLFGEEALRASIRSAGSSREAFSSPKQYLSTFELDQYDAPLPARIDRSGLFTARILLRLFMAHLLERAGTHAKQRKLPWPVPLRLARPAWDKNRAKAGEKLLQDLVITGFALADLLGSSLSKGGGLSLRDALEAVKMTEKYTEKNQNIFLLAGNGTASVSEATAVAANSSRRRGRRLVVVADVGGGTSDFASFMTPVKGKKTIAEVQGSSQILKQAGDYIDMQLSRMLLDRAGYRPGYPAAGGVETRLRANARQNKESLFNDGSLTLDIGEEMVRISLEEFLADEHVKGFAQRLRDQFHKTLSMAMACAEANRTRHGLTPPVEIMLTGGGHSLPMVRELLRNPSIPGIYIPTNPEFTENEGEFEFEDTRPQLAVAIGGAMLELPSVRSTAVIVDEPLGHTTTLGVYDAL
jgi:molecular chaperone DnaK (HSP70)